MKRRDLLVFGIFLFSVFSIVNAGQWSWNSTLGVIVGWINSTGDMEIKNTLTVNNSVNTSKLLINGSILWIKPENIIDVDYENICSGDACPFAWNISGDDKQIYTQKSYWFVNMSNNNITNVQKQTFTNSTGGNAFCQYNNGTHLIEEAC